jgi:methionyl-tRNA formyltransferase
MKGSSGVTLMTSRYWEGSYVLKRMLELGVPLTDVIVQRTWWRDNNGYEYSPEYLAMRESQLGSKDMTHYTIEELVENKGVRIHQVENINKESDLLTRLDPALIVVVGSRILKPAVTGSFPDRILNFHTGILPEYRGPYSEFWAYYNDERDMVGTTIHLIDDGIDTGDILAQVTVDVTGYEDPQSAHVPNGKAGADLIAKAVLGYLDGSIKPFPQDPDRARYFTFPTDQEIDELQGRLGKWFDLHFAD